MINFYHWITVLLRVLCTGFNCQKSNRTVIFRKTKPPGGGEQNQSVATRLFVWFCLFFLSFSKCSLYYQKRKHKSSISSFYHKGFGALFKKGKNTQKFGIFYRQKCEKKPEENAPRGRFLLVYIKRFRLSLHAFKQTSSSITSS